MTIYSTCWVDGDGWWRDFVELLFTCASCVQRMVGVARVLYVPKGHICDLHGTEECISSIIIISLVNLVMVVLG